MRGRDQLVAQLTDDMKAALEGWARSLSIEELSAITGLGEHEIKADPDSILVFDPEKPQCDVEVRRLQRILRNISNHAHDIAEYLKELHGHADEDHEDAIPPKGRKYGLAMRKLLTMRDSSMEMAQLLNGEDLDEGEEPDEFPKTFTVDSLTDHDKEVLHELADVVPHDPFAPVEDDTLKLAQVHRQIRDAVKDIPADHCTIDGRVLHSRLARILEYIRES